MFERFLDSLPDEWSPAFHQSVLAVRDFPAAPARQLGLSAPLSESNASSLTVHYMHGS